MTEFERGLHGEPKKESPKVEKLRDFTRSKEGDIFSADPERSQGTGDIGSTIMVLLIGRDSISRDELVRTILMDGVSEDKIEAEKTRAEKTIENLIATGVIIEEDGALKLAM